MNTNNILRPGLAVALLALQVHAAQADSVIDWNRRAGDLMAEAKAGTPAAVRYSAIVQTAVHDALTMLKPGSDAAFERQGTDAAVAAANRATLAKLLPVIEPSVTKAYQAAVAAIPDGPAKDTGIAAGERAALAVLARRADDGAASPDRYRPVTAPGSYVPTATPAVPHWGQRKPWLLERADQFRPSAPPSFSSATWARDFNEVKAIGSRTSTTRTPEQTEIAKFWEYSLPPIYYAVVQSVAHQGGRSALENARLYAAAAQGMDDALISVMDAKYHYRFWRPHTAIRNADADGNSATEVDAGWQSLIEAPMHPEYPSAHAILAGVVGTVVKAEAAGGSHPVLTATSPTAPGVTRRWKSPEVFMREVADSRVYEGIHYRFSTDTGLAMGRRIGELAVNRFIPAKP